MDIYKGMGIVVVTNGLVELYRENSPTRQSSFWNLLGDPIHS